MLVHQINKRHTFGLHGKLGDKLYAMPLIRYFGGGNVVYAPRGSVSFLKRQPYIYEVNVGLPTFHCLGYKVHRNGHGYRMIRPKQTLVEYHFTGIRVQPPSLWDLNYEMTPWFVAKEFDMERDIVVHRSFRYRNSRVNWGFLNNFVGRTYCVGSWHEAQFFKQWKVKWVPTKNIDDLAMVINSAKVFIGNQSTPLAIAAGLGKNRLIEEAGGRPNWAQDTNPGWWVNCTFGRENEGCLIHCPVVNTARVKMLLDGTYKDGDNQNKLHFNEYWREQWLISIGKLKKKKPAFV